MPVPGIWGPRLWKVLHRIGYYSKFPVSDVLRKDARREFDWIIQHLETIVPCPECRQHIESYRKSHPICDYPEGVAKWMWEFHEAVNERLGKPKWNIYFDTFDTLGSGKENLRSLWREYTKSIFESVQMGHLPGKNISEFTRHLLLRQGFMGC
jgi:hypothetical protein